MSGPAVDRVSPWSKAVMQRLFDWECRCAAAEEVHFDVAEELSRRNLFLGIPVVVLSAIVGTSLFASVSGNGVDVGIRIAAGTVSLIAGVLASIQTFLRFGARAEQHRVAAERWAAVKREIEKVRALPAEQVGDANELLDDIKTLESGVGQTGAGGQTGADASQRSHNLIDPRVWLPRGSASKKPPKPQGNGWPTRELDPSSRVSQMVCLPEG
jgi:hypothetical protein